MDVVLVAVGALGCVTKKLRQWIEKLGTRVRTELLQKIMPLEMAIILRKVLVF